MATFLAVSRPGREASGSLGFRSVTRKRLNLPRKPRRARQGDSWLPPDTRPGAQATVILHEISDSQAATESEEAAAAAVDTAATANLRSSWPPCLLFGPEVEVGYICCVCFGPLYC